MGRHLSPARSRWLLSLVPVPRFAHPRNETGDVVRWFGTNTDVTEQIEAEKALRESETRVRELADNLGIDLLAAMDKKIDKNAKKYPVAKAKGRAAKAQPAGRAASSRATSTRGARAEHAGGARARTRASGGGARRAAGTRGARAKGRRG